MELYVPVSALRDLIQLCRIELVTQDQVQLGPVILLDSIIKMSKGG